MANSETDADFADRERIISPLRRRMTQSSEILFALREGSRMIDAILFDLGDTIIDFGVGRREALLLFRQGAKLSYHDLRTRDHPNLPTYDRYLKTHYRIMQRAYLWSRLSGRDFSYETILQRAAAKLGLHLNTPDLPRLAYIWYQPISLASTIDDGVQDVLRCLQAAGTRLGIVSNTIVPPHCLDQHLEDEGLLRYFPVRVYSSEVRYRKPHPRIFALALQRIGVPAQRTLFIGDLLKADIAGAKKAGMHTLWKPSRDANGHFPPPPRRHHADGIIFKLRHLPDVLPRFGWRPSGNAEMSIQAGDSG
jgi:putative hydrolase of the HAD superfamily